MVSRRKKIVLVLLVLLVGYAIVRATLDRIESARLRARYGPAKFTRADVGGSYYYGDGLGVRVQMRSYSEIDQRTGRMSSLARQTYYAGVRPSQGLTFGGETAVYPIPSPSRDLKYELRTNPRELHWDDRQRLHSGFISARSGEQFLVVVPRPS